MQNTGDKEIMFLFPAFYIAVTVVVIHPEAEDQAGSALEFLCKLLESDKLNDVKLRLLYREYAPVLDRNGCKQPVAGCYQRMRIG